jgi:hypothetical protein
VTFTAVRKGSLVCALGAVIFLSAASSSRVVSAARADTGAVCAGVPDGSTQTVPSPGHPCWVAADPYPFGTDGNPVDPTSAICVRSPLLCYLNVTSMAFRDWNRGLAVTTNPGGSSTPFGVWLFNGTRWYPDPTFPGTRTCQGNTILWAGKLDYWLIGTGQNGWAPLCRFDGSNFLWEPLPMPIGTVLRLGNPVTGQLPADGGITSGSCLSWDNCWFFGTDDTVLHWDGETLSDVSPDAPATWAGTTFTAAQLNAGLNGSAIGLAAVGTSYAFDVNAGIPLPTRASLPTQLFSFDGTTPDGRRLGGSLLTSISYQSPAAAQAASSSEDPYGTDPVALSLDPSGRGWLATNPAGWQVGVGVPFLRPDLGVAERSPLVPVSTGPGTSTGPDPGCPSWLTNNGSNQFPHTYDTTAGTVTPGSMLWSSISSFPGGESALSGGQTFSTLSDGSVVPEPAIIQASCDGTATTTRFRIPDPSGLVESVPADESGWVSAVAANASNDGWAATSNGRLPTAEVAYQPPELYRFTDGTAPNAPAGNDIESRPVQSQQDPPVYVYVAPKPPKLPPLPVAAKTKHQPPPISDLRRRIVRGAGTYTLVLSFKVHRRVVLGVDAYRGRGLVASTGLESLGPPSAELRLSLSKKRWPTHLAFITDAPKAALAVHGGALTGDVELSATAKPIAGRTIKSVQFQYALSGTGYWIVIGNAKRSPFRLSFKTSDLANGTYDLRVVAKDSHGRTGISRVIAGRTIKNGRG